MDNASSATDIDPQNITSTTTRLQDVDVCNLVMKSPDEKSEFLPVYRSGSCAEQGPKQFIVCIDDLVDHLGAAVVEWSSLGAFYGVFDGHGGTDAALFVSKNILRFIVEDSYFPLCVKKAIKSAFLKADYEFADDSSLNISSGTTALILGRRLIIANAGACRAVLVRKELMIHNDPERCSRELVREALKGNTCDSLTVIVVCFSPESALERIPSYLFKVIVSCLSYKEALVIKLASKSFYRQVKILPDQVCANGKSPQSFRDSLLRNEQDARVGRFSLKLKSRDIDEVVVNDCLVNVLNRGVLDFELDINVSRDYRLPVSLFTCSTVVNLKLGSGFEIDIPQDGLLPSVKSIMLDSITFSGGDMFNTLLEKCPSLETLEKNGKRFYTTVTMRLLGRPYNEYSKNIFHHGQGRFYKYSEKKRLCVCVIKIPAFKDEISEIGRILDTFTNLERLEIGIPGMLTPDIYLSTVQGLLALPRASPRCKIVVTKF